MKPTKICFEGEEWRMTNGWSCALLLVQLQVNYQQGVQSIVTVFDVRHRKNRLCEITRIIRWRIEYNYIA